MNHILRILRKAIPVALLLFLLPILMAGRGQDANSPGEPLLVNSLLPVSLHPSVPVDPTGDALAVTIPLKRAGRLFLIEATVAGQTGNFVFDTGAARLVLNRTYYREGLSPAGDRSGGITGSIENVFHLRVPEIDLSGIRFENLEADVIHLGQIENRRGIKILGLFGMNLFRNLELVFDLRNNALHLYRTDRSGNRLQGADTLRADCSAAIRESGGVAFIRATIGGRDLDFCLDTGAEVNVLSNSTSRKALETITVTRRTELTGSGGSRQEVMYGTMNEFFIGTHPLHPMQTMITGLGALAESYNYPLSGVLGYDFFEKGIVRINLVKRELGLSLVREAEQ